MSLAASTEDLVLRNDVRPITAVQDAQPGVFIPPYEHCIDPLPGEVGAGPDGKVCTNVAISGCTEPGKYFPDYGSCEVVRTQRPFWEQAPAREPRADDPRLSDRTFMTELDWVTTQVEASACTCCHDSRINGGKTGQWDINRGPIWLDTLSDSGLALFVGLADSSALGAYPPSQNHGFDRERTGIPTTDPERMQTFLRAEMVRRGISEAQAAAVPPFGGPIYTNRFMQPTACVDQGVDPEGLVQLAAAKVRYLYVMRDGSDNPGVPPNLDTPEGTLWRLDVLASEAALGGSFEYGTTPAGSFQVMPEAAAAPVLAPGTRYHFVALRDVGVPVVNCTFTFGEPLSGGGNTPVPSAASAASRAATDPPSMCTLLGGDAAGFGATCTDGQNSTDCTCAADYCALMPGQSQGYCTLSGCNADPSLCPAGWTCLDLSIFSPTLPAICTPP